MQLLPYISTIITKFIYGYICHLQNRSEENGRLAVTKLEAEGLRPKFHQLDIDSAESIGNLREYLSETYGGLDVLINNAGIAYKAASTAPFSEQATNTIKTNFTGTLNITRALMPLVRPHGRIVNVSSFAGKLQQVGKDLQKRFSDPALTEVELVGLMQKFVDDVIAGDHQSKGWSNTAYGMSKLGVTALTKVNSIVLLEICIRRCLTNSFTCQLEYRHVCTCAEVLQIYNTHRESLVHNHELDFLAIIVF